MASGKLVKGTPNAADQITLGDGAKFWVYISPENSTNKVVKGWSVTFSKGDWTGKITSDNPTAWVQAADPPLSGEFKVSVYEINYSTNPPIEIPVPPSNGSSNTIGCNRNCASMVGIVANETTTPGAANSTFWTTWDAICKKSK
ncbi:hypothetical protein [Microbulbifer sp. GL-2]|uniref:hypothetical protein n=1 Tax=Microbulbifer sp. GL-2 TaxID=2591606 RepID=UPI00116423E3|nr:hypothetical protein [Microbulbifer sp. GL-2]BBM02903.1 hypothetical protein GL2_29770 [Microbulbifer sp. GL-2]